MIKKIAKLLIPIVLIALLVRNIGEDWLTISSHWADLRIVPFIASFLFLLVDYPEGAFCWHMVLRKMRLKIDFWTSHRIWIISTTARYIPGSIWQYLGRVELARMASISRSKTITSLLIEALIVLVAGIVVAALAFPFLGISELGNGVWIFLLPIPLFLFHPDITNRVIAIIAKVSGRKIGKVHINFSFKDAVSIFPWFVFNFFINGAALFFLVMALTGDGTISDFFAFTGFYALSWVLGYIAIFAPAGIGVTEFSLAYLLSFSMPLSLASAIAISYRIFLTMAELLIFLFVLRFRK